MGERVEIEEMKRLLDQLPDEDPNLKETFYEEYVTNGYIIYDGKKNKAACTRCGNEWDLYPKEYSRMHGLRELCPCCGAENTLLAAGRGRQKFTEYHRVLSFSEKDGTLWGFLNYLIVSFEDMGRPQLYNNLQEIYAFNRDEQTRWSKKTAYYGDVWYERMKRIIVPSAPCAPYCATKWSDHVYLEGLRDMISKSDCKYTLETNGMIQHQDMDLPAYFATMMRYHSVELLAKAGFWKIAQKKIDGGGCRAVNWRGDSLEKILKLPKGDIKRLRAYDPSCAELETYQLLTSEERRSIPIPVLRDMLAYREYDYKKKKYINTYKERVEKFMPFDKWVRWAKTQDHYMRESRSYTYLIRDYRDYMAAAEKLGMDIRKKSVLRPKDLKQAHDDTIERLKIERNAAIDQLIAANSRAESFRSDHLMIMTAVCQEDLNKESAKLGHCVKTYGNKLAEGRCYIFFVRDVKAPEIPYYTLETKPNGDFVQCRGKHNCSMTDDVKLFTDAFVKKLKADIKKERKSACQTA